MSSNGVSLTRQLVPKILRRWSLISFAMPRFLSALMPPFLMLFSIPLAALAFLTTIVAFLTLFVRVLVVYMDLALVVAHNQFFHYNLSSHSRPPVKGSLPSPAISQQRRKKGTSSLSSAWSMQGAITSKALDTTTLEIITSAGIDRDFEGVGGWRFPGPDEDDTQWISSNTRLRIPAATRDIKGKHNCLRTSEVLATPRGTGDPGTLKNLSKSPLQPRARTPPATRLVQSATFEEYFPSQPLYRSNPTLHAANVGKTRIEGTSHPSSAPLHGSSRGNQIRISDR